MRDEAFDQRLDIGRRRCLLVLWCKLFPDPAALAQLALEIGPQLARGGRETRDIGQRQLFQPRRIERSGGAPLGRLGTVGVIHLP